MMSRWGCAASTKLRAAESYEEEAGECAVEVRFAADEQYRRGDSSGLLAVLDPSDIDHARRENKAHWKRNEDIRSAESVRMANRRDARIRYGEQLKDHADDLADLKSQGIQGRVDARNTSEQIAYLKTQGIDGANRKKD